MSDDTYTIYPSLAGKVVLITGGATGIGASLVEAFSAQKSRVHFLDIAVEAGEALSTSTGAAFHACDLTDIAALRATIADVATKEGGVDVLVNNAANDNRHDVMGVEPDAWRRTLAVNLDHQFFASQAVIPSMQEKGAGVIILTSSTSFMMGHTGMVAYTTAKAGIIGLNRTLAREFGPFGIRVNCIIPGAIRTERQASLWRTPEGDAEILKKQALKIHLGAADIARMALFLASDDARGCTASQFVVDAGLT